MPWYRLPSGQPYHTNGPAPPGATPISGPRADREVLLPPDGEPLDAFLAQPVDVVMKHVEAADVDVDTLDRLLSEERTGRDRSTLTDALERMKANAQTPQE